MTEYSRLSRFGMMYKPLTETLGEELLMLYREDFHAKTSLPQVKEQGLTESGQKCGKRWQGLLARYDHNMFLWKTVQCSLLGGWEQYSETFPRWGTMRNGELFQQPMWEQTILEKEFGLSEKVPNNLDFFHTPNTTGMDGGSNSRKALKKRMEQWLTPDANCGNRGTQETWLPVRPSGQPAQYTINQAVRDSMKIWSTPVASDTSHRKNKYAQGGTALSTQAGGKLNPMWVEWLMGWPLGWTDLNPLAMDKFQKWLEQHGMYLKED
jgi:hypothetical protein